MPGIFVGSFLIEVFFSIPGVGREIILAVNRSDYPVIQAFTVYLAMITMLVNLAVDILYKLVDPRVVLEVSAVLPTGRAGRAASRASLRRRLARGLAAHAQGQGGRRLARGRRASSC